ncbi:MAG: hypothetical protein WC861_00875 [Candidatus Micrarchaeia archaeon]|jgi:hypothetical protein
MGIKMKRYGEKHWGREIETRVPGTAIPKAKQRRGVLGRLDAMTLSEFRKLPLLKREKLISDARLAQLLTYSATQYLSRWIALRQIQGGSESREIWEKLAKENMVDRTDDQVWVEAGESFSHNYHRESSEVRQYDRKRSKAILGEIDALIGRCIRYVKDGPPNYAEAVRLLMRINRKILEKASLDGHYEVWCRRGQAGSGLYSKNGQM